MGVGIGGLISYDAPALFFFRFRGTIMAEVTEVELPTITGNMLFYKKPELLNVQAHGKLGITPLTEQPFAFLRDTQVVPINVSEFNHVALNYPIIFAGEEKTPAAVMGLKTDQNAFVDEDGKIAPGVYLPAYIRRYPFASAKNTDDANSLMICIDRSSPLVTENADSPFFEGQELAEVTKQAVEFVKIYETEIQGTVNFVKMLKDYDLFETIDVLVAGPPDAQSQPTQQKMGTYEGISEEKIAGLSDERLIELRNNGGLAAIYAHRLSQANWQRLLNMEMSQELKKVNSAGKT